MLCAYAEKQMKKNKFLVLIPFQFLFLYSALGYSQINSQTEKLIQNSWGLVNLGQPQVFDLNPMQTYRLQARTGQDIHLLPAQLGKKIRVAVIDTGVDIQHPSVKNQIYHNAKECAATDRTIDNDGNEYPGDCTGWSILGDTTPNNIIGTGDFQDEIGHGTHVAGIIASVSKNIEIVPIQVIKQADHFNYQPLKPFSIGNFDLSPKEDIRGGFSSTDPSLADRIARAIIYAMSIKADVINLSLGWPPGSDAEIMRAAIAEAQSRGILVVAAAGNDSTSALLRPCQYKGVICVAAHNPDGAISSFSNYGFGVDLAAPGASIISSVPETFRSARVPGFFGVEILSGTSQASPYVAGAIAEMLSRGIPSQDIYARLILGSRPVQTDLPVLVGPINTAGVPVSANSKYTKDMSGGLLDMTNSMKVIAQPLILNADKEIQEIQWDRKTADLAVSFPLKNYWKGIQNKNISVVVENRYKLSVYPNIVSAKISGSMSTWNSGEERNLDLKLKIQDTLSPSQSRLPSDLEFSVKIMLDGKLHRQFFVKSEVVLNLTKDSVDADILKLPVTGVRERGMKMFLIDEVYDNQLSNRDYFALSQDDKKGGFNIGLTRQIGAEYKIEKSQFIKFDGNVNRTNPLSRIRMDIDFDGVSEYILGLQEFKDDGRDFGSSDYTLHFYIFDQNMNLKRHEAFYDVRSLIPRDYTWIRVGNELRPAWVTQGQPVVKNFDVTDLWSTDDTTEVKAPTLDQDIYFYYLDQNFKLAQIQNPAGAKIVDLIQPTLNQIKSGIIPVLVARNLGSEIKPSYLNTFSMGWIQNEKLANEKNIENLSVAQNYRNLVDTGKDKAHNLNSEADEFRGTFWFGFDAHQKQRITTIDFKNNKMTDQLIGSERNIFDAALRVRSVYLGQNRKGVFIITNTEIEYHNLNATAGAVSVARSSLNKYTFIGDNLVADLQFPVTIASQNLSTNAVQPEKSPALFTTEGSGLNRGVKMLVPIFAKDGSVQQMVSPARLRLKSPQGCKALDYPVYLGSDYAMDFDCGTQMLRIKLRY